MVRKTVQVQSLSRVDEDEDVGRLTPWGGRGGETRVGVGESAANRRHYDEDADWDTDDHAIGTAHWRVPQDLV